MLEKYLEKEILRRLKIITLLWEFDCLPSAEMAAKLGVSSATIKGDIKKINLQFCDKINPLIVSELAGYSVLNKKNRNKKKYLQKILNSSLFLKATVFFSKNKFTKIDEFKRIEYISQAKAYNLKKDVEEYLKQLGIAEKGVILERAEYKIRFLLAYYQWELGIEIIKVSEVNKTLFEKLFNEVESVERCFFSSRSKEYAGILFQLNFERRNKNILTFCDKQKEIFTKSVVYQRKKKIIKEFLKENLHFDIKEDEVFYFALVFNMMNASFYDDTSETFASYISLIQESTFFDYDCLVQEFEKEFKFELKNSDLFEATITTFIRKCFFDLQTLIPEEHISLGCVVKVSDSFVQRISKVLKLWNYKVGLGYSFSCSHILQLATKLFFVLEKKKRLKQVYLLTSFHTDYLLAKEVLTNEFGALVDIKPFNASVISQSCNDVLILYDINYDVLSKISSQKLKIKYIFDLKELQQIRSLLFEYNLEGIKDCSVS